MLGQRVVKIHGHMAGGLRGNRAGGHGRKWKTEPVWGWVLWGCVPCVRWGPWLCCGKSRTRRSKIGKDTPFAGEKRKWIWTRIWKFRIMQGWTSAASRIRMLRVRRQRPGTASAPGPGRWRSERGKACASSPEPWRLLSLRGEREPPAPGLPSPARAAPGAGLVALGSAEGCGEGTATHPLVPSCPIFLLPQPHSCPASVRQLPPRHGPRPRRPDAGTRRPSPSAGHLVLPNTHTHTHTRPCAHTHTCAHTQVPPHLCAYTTVRTMHTHAHAYLHTHACTPTHVRTRASDLARRPRPCCPQGCPEGCGEERGFVSLTWDLPAPSRGEADTAATLDRWGLEPCCVSGASPRTPAACVCVGGGRLRDLCPQPGEASARARGLAAETTVPTLSLPSPRTCSPLWSESRSLCPPGSP
ncbi:uncharacterized protein LOC125124816 [Phacochoerus africanus]|uniref:uncharacterized protein LOC125124816 n=1 Tax=Phacochoerus africanus TaxID=41426 RepID=UPI001FD8AD52|nr:uncharacterized protein LOC125124816 [Phacochoerus africanus]XP_047630923.1 uncharacterized protein LOC125124816 [Phacochoerus africanus]XP_047630924.1 uncharacterized protein LOC125124816 [Phacochoerus africanus]